MTTEVILQGLATALAGLAQAVAEQVVNPNANQLQGKTLAEVVEQALQGKANGAEVSDNALLLQGQTVDQIVAAVTKSSVGLNLVENFAPATLEDIQQGSALDRYMTVLRTKQMVDQAVLDLVNGAPTALDTLKEIADKLAEDDTALAAILTSLDNKLGKTEQSADSAKLAGLTLAQVISQALAGKAATAGQSDTALKLAVARSISMSGDGTWTVNFNGSGNATAALTLANSGVTAGTYFKVTVDAKGRVTTGAALAASDIPSLDASKITTGTLDAARLPFTPVQQGGGTGQGTNKVYIGWTASKLAVQVDSTNFGTSWPIDITGNAATVTGLGTMGKRNVTISTAAPSGGADGDIWIQYS